jgi:hypothetical protein
MELHVLSDRRLALTQDWQRAIDAEGFPLQLEPNVQLASVNGFLPAQLRNEAAGFECFNDDARRTEEFLGDANFDKQWRFALGLRWLGSSTKELQAAWMAAIAYAEATKGILFDHEDGRVLRPDEARIALGNITREFASLDAILAKVKNSFSPRK